MPRRRGLVVFGGGGGAFRDNSAYAFLAASADPDLTAIWVSGSKHVRRRLRAAGLRAVPRRSLAEAWHGARARVVVTSGYLSDVAGSFAAGAVVFNVWHGLPLKLIERDITSGPLSERHRHRHRGSLVASALWSKVTPPDYVLSTTPEMSRRFASAFGVSADRCLELGYPRTDHLLTGGFPEMFEALVVSRAEFDRLRDAPLVVMYLPTWRDDGRDMTREVDLDQLASIVTERGGVLVYKPHPLSPTPAPDVDRPYVVLAPDDAVNVFLPLADVLVTDYSSVAFDFMLTRRPIVYYLPDLDDYASMRGFYEPVANALVGAIARTPEELYATLGRSLPDEPPPDLDEVIARYWGPDPRPSAPAVVAQLRRWAL